MSDPANKAELLARMQSGYASFEGLLDSLSAEQKSTAGVNGDWAIKDIMAHLTAWQDRVSQRLEAIERREEPAFEVIENDEQMNRFNEAVFLANRERPLSEVEANFRASAERLRLDAAKADERDLFEAGRFPWLKGGVLWESVAGNSFEHYEEHTPMIQEWLAGQPGQV